MIKMLVCVYLTIIKNVEYMISRIHKLVHLWWWCSTPGTSITGLYSVPCEAIWTHTDKTTNSVHTGIDWCVHAIVQILCTLINIFTKTIKKRVVTCVAVVASSPAQATPSFFQRATLIERLRVHGLGMRLYISMQCSKIHSVWELYTVEPPNKGHIGDNINSAVLSFIERLSYFRGSKTIGHVIFGTSNSVLCREVYYTMSLFRRVHYWRLHCISTIYNCHNTPVGLITSMVVVRERGGVQEERGSNHAMVTVT